MAPDLEESNGRRTSAVSRDPLEDLLADENAFARETLASALSPLLKLSRSGDLFLEPAFSRLKARQQVLTILLGLKAAEMLGIRESAATTPGEVVELSGMAPGTVRPKLSELLRQRLIVRRKDGGYEVPVSAANQALDSLQAAKGGRNGR
jgi:DNA-binding transcriptional ArsR family regulator